MLLNKEDSLVLLIDVQEKLTSKVLNHESMLASCKWILHLARTLFVPILASEQYPKGLGATVETLSSFFSPQQCFEKIHFSCAQQPDYLQRLRELKKKQLVLIGIEAHVCVLQTAIELKDLGFDVYVVVNAVSSRHSIDLKYGLKRMRQQGVHLVTSEMVFFEWVKLAGSSEFKTLSKEFLQ